MNAVPFAPDRPAVAAHAALRRSLAAAEQAQQCAVQWFGEIMRRKLYRDLGYSSINQYARRRLGFSKTRTGDFVRLASRLQSLPAVDAAVARGEIGYTKAREIVKVATPATERQWLAAAAGPRRVLEREVARARREARVAPGQAELIPDTTPVVPPPALPARFIVDLTPEQDARREALWERLRKLGGVPADRGEVLLEALAALVEAREAAVAESSAAGTVTAVMGPPGDPPGEVAQIHSATETDLPGYPPGGAMPLQPAPPASRTPRGAPPFQVHVHLCPQCNAGTVQTRRGEKPLDAADIGRVTCDARVARPGRHNTTTIPPRIRREVLARDRHRCRAPGCGRTRFLEVHHVKPRSRGGTNSKDNLITLCAACHRLWHERQGRPGVWPGAQRE